MQKIIKILNLIWNEFVYGGHLISLGAVSIVFTSAILLGIKITWSYLVAVYLGTHSIYLYNRFKEIKKDILTDPERTKHLKRYIKNIPLIIMLLSLGFLGILLYSNKILALVLAILLFVCSLLYTIFLKKITKKIVSFKSFFVSLIWALLVIFLALYYSFPLNLSLLLVFIFVFLRLFVHEEFSNIKDVKGDEKEGLLTLAIIFNKRELSVILNLITALAAIPIIYGICLKVLPNFSIGLLLVLPYGIYCLKKEKKLETKFLHYILIDGEFILWSIFISLNKFLFSYF